MLRPIERSQSMTRSSSALLAPVSCSCPRHLNEGHLPQTRDYDAAVSCQGAPYHGLDGGLTASILAMSDTISYTISYAMSYAILYAGRVGATFGSGGGVRHHHKKRTNSERIGKEGFVDSQRHYCIDPGRSS